MSHAGSRPAHRGLRFALPAVVTVALLLAGCFKADVDLTVAPDGRVSGTMVLGYSLRGMAEWTGADAHRKAASLLETLDGSGIAGMHCRAADDDDYAGVRCTLHDVPNERIGSIWVEGSRIWFTADGNRLTVHGAVDATQQMLPEGVGYDVHLRITFPGRVIGEATGDVEGRTVSWAPPQGQLTRIEASGTVPGMPATNLAPPRAVAPLTVLGTCLVVLAGLVAVVRQRRLG